jgi:hypothetical protein
MADPVPFFLALGLALACAVAGTAKAKTLF